MRKALLALFVVIILVVFGLPYLSYAGISDDGAVRVHYDVSAYVGSYGSAGAFTIDYEFGVNYSVDFVDYIGIWWGDVIDVTSSVPESYPCVALTTQLNFDASTRWTNFWAYEYGEVFEYDGVVWAQPGDSIQIQIQIYFAQSYGTHDYVSFTVPG